MRSPPVAWSAYDEAMPAPVGLDSAVARFAELRARRRPDSSRLALVRDVVVVVSSSRGGSTYLGELLRRCPGMLHLPAEINPLFTIAGLSEEPGRVLAEEVSLAVGRPPAAGEPLDLADAADRTAWRLVAQWPALEIDIDDARRWAAAARARIGDPVAFQVDVLRRARAAHPSIDPWSYDLPSAVVRRSFPGVHPTAGPPSDDVVEMPPFVLVRPWARATDDELASMPVVLTTPRNSFRIDAIERLFPRARVHILHLTRNPAAAVNGLMDGWVHRGFFSVRVPAELRIHGYTRRDRPWTRAWWCFDPWPGWEAMTDRPLADVCAAQWLAAHRAALAAAAAPERDAIRIRFEDLHGRRPADRAVLYDLADWLGFDASAGARLVATRLRPLMATAPPAARRWTARAREILPAIRAGAVSEMAGQLGYDNPSTWR